MGVSGSKAAHLPSFKRARKLREKVSHAIRRSKSVDSRVANIPDSGRFSVESYPLSSRAFPRSESDQIAPYPRSDSDKIMEAYSSSDGSSPCTPRLLLEWQHRIGDDFFDEALELEFYECEGNECEAVNERDQRNTRGNGAERTGLENGIPKNGSSVALSSSELPLSSEAGAVNDAEDRRVIVDRILGSVQAREGLDAGLYAGLGRNYPIVMRLSDSCPLPSYVVAHS